MPPATEACCEKTHNLAVLHIISSSALSVLKHWRPPPAQYYYRVGAVETLKVRYDHQPSADEPTCDITPPIAN